MTNQNPYDILQSSNNNVIKIPYSDNQEESLKETTFNVNGFTIIELDEENNDYSKLISLYDEEQHIESKQQINLKSKAKSIENYYANSKDSVVANVNCSRCLLGNYSPNELLYFKDRKTFVAYLKYCFLYYKKNLFMNHSIYMNNKYDVFKINQTFYSGWKFSIPKTLCKACFLQIINMDYLVFNIKNIICDYNSCINSRVSSEKKISNSSRNKKRRIIPKSKGTNNKRSIENKKNGDETCDNNTNNKLMEALISKNENKSMIKKKRRRNSISFFRKRRLKKPKKRNVSKYNKNVVYDSENNILIINKKNVAALLKDDNDSIIIKSIINIKEKDTENIGNEKTKQAKKKDEKLKFISNLKIESNSLTNKKTNIEEKKSENSNKDIDGNKNSKDTKNTIIINNINNNNGLINTDNVGQIQYNSNQNNFNIYSNKDYNLAYNLKDNINRILMNDLISIYSIYAKNSSRLIMEKLFYSINTMNALLKYMCSFTLNIFYILLYSPNYVVAQISMFFQKLKMIEIDFNEAEASIDYAINAVKNSIMQNQKLLGIDNYIWTNLNDEIKLIEEQAIEMKKKYNRCIQYCFVGCFVLRNVMNNIIA